MQLTTQEFQSDAVGAVEGAAFKVEMNAMLFHSVIDGIYADKVRAPMRELATNAYDGHRAAGNGDEPFDVTLPTDFDPQFIVRDYGTSLTHEQIMGIYSTMFASTKRDSNDAVGMIGLGSKSPFAYTSAFSITAYLNGQMRLYSAYIKDDGVPQIALMYEAPTNERNGIQVAFAVEKDDIKKFHRAASGVFFGFDPKPNILNADYQEPDPGIVAQGDGWVHYEPNRAPFGNRLMARQGCVLYPIDPAPLNLDTFLYGWPVVIDFPIGELSVATSREQLGYDTKTIANLTKRIQATTEAMIAQVEAEIQGAPTWLDACVALVRGLRSSSRRMELFRQIRNSARWQDKPLQVNIRIGSNMGSELEMTQFVPSVHQMGVLRKQVAFKSRLLSGYTECAEYFRDRTIIFYEPAGTKNAPSRMRRVIHDTADKTVIWFRGAREAFDNLLATLPGAKWTDLTTVEPLAAVANATQPGVTLSVISATANYHATVNRVRIVPTKDMIYVQMQDGRYTLGSKSLRLRELQGYIRQMVTNGVIANATPILVIGKANAKLLADVSLRPLQTAAETWINEHVDLKMLASRMHVNDLTRTREAALKLMRQAETVGIELPADIAKIAKGCIEGIVIEPAPRNFYSLRTMISDLAPHIIKQVMHTNAPWVDKWAELQNQYPLLNEATQSATQFAHYMGLITKCPSVIHTPATR